VPIEAEARALEESERRVLDHLLSVDFPGVAELRVQRAALSAQRTCRCGCASIDLVLDASAPLAEVVDTVPVSAHGALPEPIGAVTVLLFAHQGRLSLMEIASYGDHVPDTWPEPESLTIDRAHWAERPATHMQGAHMPRVVRFDGGRGSN
jgi:hypothetical protein